MPSAWILHGARSQIGFEDVGEFQVMFHMSTDSFGGPSRQVPRHIAHLDGPLIEKALHDNAFSGQICTPMVPTTHDLS